MRFVAILVAVASMFMANVAFATPDCRPCPYSCSDLGLGKKDCSVVSDTRGVCCLDLTQKGLELAKAQASELSLAAYVIAKGGDRIKPAAATGGCL